MKNRYCIASILENYFNRGIPVEDDVVEYAESVLGIFSIDEIGELLSDKDSYGDGIVDLVFYPGQELRVDIELHIPAEGMSEDVQEKIIEYLLKRISYTKIYFRDRDYTASIVLSEFILRNFISRLNLDKQVDCSRLKSIDSPEERVRYAKARAKIRNSNFVPTTERNKFLCSLIKALSNKNIDEDTFFGCLELILRLFSEVEDDKNVYNMISEKKRFWQNSLNLVRRFDEDFSRYSMDILMSLRIQPPVIDVEEVNRDIYLADEICIALFGMVAESGIL